MRYLSLFCILFLSYNTQAQHVLNGKINDKNTGEPLIGATILYADGVGTVSNFDGQFELRLKKGTYTITASYVGYQAYQKEIRMDINYFLIFLQLSQLLLLQLLVQALP